VHVESLSSGDSAAVFDDNRGEVISLTFSPNGKLLAAGDVSLDYFIQCSDGPPLIYWLSQSSGRIVLIDVVEKKVIARMLTTVCSF
jgi:WD40 repeat protein